jgi:hypothetical protein
MKTTKKAAMIYYSVGKQGHIDSLNKSKKYLILLTIRVLFCRLNASSRLQLIQKLLDIIVRKASGLSLVQFQFDVTGKMEMDSNSNVAQVPARVCACRCRVSNVARSLGSVLSMFQLKRTSATLARIVIERLFFSSESLA